MEHYEAVATDDNGNQIDLYTSDDRMVIVVNGEEIAYLPELEFRLLVGALNIWNLAMG